MRRLLVLLSVAALALTATAIGYAASFSLTTTHLGASAVTTPVMFPTTVTITNKGGGTLHKPESGDIITLVYSQLVNAPTICSGWTNSGSNAAAKLQWTIVAGAGGADDTLIADGAAAPCNTGLFIGSIDLGAAGYDTSATNINYPTTTANITFGTSTTTITATLNGQKNGTPAVVSTGNQATWTPNTVVTDRSGNNCGSNIAKSTSTLQF